MKILHTSDWHIGRSLYGRKRYDEFEAFLNWLEELIVKESVDALLVAGDVFDTSTPGNRAQELYYRFLCRVSLSCCRHIVVVAGNHDSPSFLDAPKDLLRALNVYVVGSAVDNPEDEVITLTGLDNQPEAIICAVPYLRDRDIRMVEPGETVENKNLKLIQGVKNHYEIVCKIAVERQAKYKKAGVDGYIPLIGMGHLFTAGGKTVDGDGVRELYVGSLAHVSKEIFPDCLDYMALGHLHVPQKVGGSEHIRYSGSPIPMGYGEAVQKKKVVLIELDGTKSPNITECLVPCFQPLVRITGEMSIIAEKILELKSKKSNAWLEIEYIGTDIVGNLRELINEALSGSAMEVRRIKNKRIIEQVMTLSCDNETLDDLDENDVFLRCIDAHEISKSERSELIHSYKEIIATLYDADPNVE